MNNQYGFRKQKGTREFWDLVYLLVNRLKGTYIAFIDLEKAFDSVNWNILFPTLQEIGIEQQDLKIIHSLYK